MDVCCAQESDAPREPPPPPDEHGIREGEEGTVVEQEAAGEMDESPAPAIPLPK